jgi:hypothetical protein
LKNPQVADCVSRVLIAGMTKWRLYELIAWVIMANHVHVLIRPLVPLGKALMDIKSASARVGLMRFSGELESLFGRMSHTITLCGAIARDWRLFGIFIAIRLPPAWLLNLTIGLGPRLDGSAWRRPTLLSPA